MVVSFFVMIWFFSGLVCYYSNPFIVKNPYNLSLSGFNSYWLSLPRSVIIRDLYFLPALLQQLLKIATIIFSPNLTPLCTLPPNGFLHTTNHFIWFPCIKFFSGFLVNSEQNPNSIAKIYESLYHLVPAYLLLFALYL